MSSQARERTVETSRAVSPGLAGDAFPAEALQGVYQAIYQRRDIRSFRSDPFPDDVLARLLNAAHHAPSVGFMQPWSFLLVRDGETRTQVKALFDRERQAAACFFDEPRRSQYLSFKLEGILDAPLNICVTCESYSGRPHRDRPQQHPGDRCLTPPVARWKTSGWLLAPKASASAGSRSSSCRNCERSWASRRITYRSHCPRR